MGRFGIAAAFHGPPRSTHDRRDRFISTSARPVDGRSFQSIKAVE
jgi:hypothetical protein